MTHGFSTAPRLRRPNARRPARADARSARSVCSVRVRVCTRKLRRVVNDDGAFVPCALLFEAFVLLPKAFALILETFDCRSRLSCVGEWQRRGRRRVAVRIGVQKV
jgi:hypothetical protein